MILDLKPCPFCGSEDVELSNTHTSIFTVSCISCWAEATGDFFEGPPRSDRFHYDADPRGEFEADLDHLYPEYKEAALSAIAAWNQRTPHPDTSWMAHMAKETEINELLIEISELQRVLEDIAAERDHWISIVEQERAMFQKEFILTAEAIKGVIKENASLRTDLAIMQRQRLRFIVSNGDEIEVS